MLSQTMTRLFPCFLWGLTAGLPVIGLGQTSRLATYEHDQQTAFALSLSADLSRPAGEIPPHDVVVLYDTSASQLGAFRDDGLAALTAMLRDFSSQDRVQILMVDVAVTPVTSDWIDPLGADAQAALANIRQRTPLGASDLVLGLREAQQRLEDSAHARHIVYIGDAVSRLQLFGKDELTELTEALTAAQTSVSSFAIGPQRDLQLLAILANQTGGNVLVDHSDLLARDAGAVLAEIVKAPVFWPQEASLPSEFLETFPHRLPPLRGDRDSIVIGLAQRVEGGHARIVGMSDGAPAAIDWTLTMEPTNSDFASLPALIDMARRDDGVSLPTVGSAGLRETLRLLGEQAAELAQMAREALQRDERQDAHRLVAAALRIDPTNPTAHAIMHQLTESDGKRGSDAEVAEPAADDGGQAQLSEKTWFVQRVIDENAVLQDGVIEPAGPIDGVIFEPAQLRVAPAQAARQFDADGQFVDRVIARRQAQEGLLRTLVRNGIADARDSIRDDPDLAIQDLKLLLENVRRTPDVSEDLRSQLQNQVRSAIRTTARRQVEKQQLDAAAARSLAQAETRRGIAEATRLREEQIKGITDRFNHLMDERQYALANEAADVIAELAPDTVLSSAAVAKSDYVYNYDTLDRINVLKNRGFLATLMEVERSHIPFPDEPPLVYPPADFWEEITRKREKYKSIDLATPGSAEERIFKELETTTGVDFAETPLEEALRELEQVHGIDIYLDRVALDTAQIDPQAPISIELKEISLRSALKLILKELDLTYVIRDEVLQVTTVEEAEANPVTKVYPVGDLVVPIISGLGGGGGIGGIGGGGLGGALNGGGGGGFGGGGGGFGGGGLGGGGGGFGGGGLGGGGGGGFFDVDDPVSLQQKPAKALPQPIQLAESNPSPAAWQDFFRQQRGLPELQRVSAADVRETVRRLMAERDYSQIQAVIQAALVEGMAQPWMYEALGLALLADKAPVTEVERALLSAVDLGGTVDEMYYAATYLARIGLDRSALRLLRTIAATEPARAETYAMAPKLARRSHDPDGVRWACLGVLRQAWPLDQKDVEKEARLLANATILRLEADGRHDQALAFRRACENAVARDCIASVSWGGDADVDVLVKEPAGSVCSLRNRRTRSGGLLLNDGSSLGAESSSAEGIFETYVCAEALDGKYQVLVRPVWGHVAGGQVSVTVAVHYGTPQQQILTQQVVLADEPVLVEFELAGGRLRRTIGRTPNCYDRGLTPCARPGDSGPTTVGPQ